MRSCPGNVRTFLAFVILTLIVAVAKSQAPEPLASQALISKLKWRCIGPYIGGRVVTVTGVPGNKNLFYAGTIGLHLENVAAEVDHSEEPTDQRIPEKEAKLAAVEPGMNRLQWDLRYPYATEVAGYRAPIAAGGLEDSVEGPVVVPGTYSVVLDYNGEKTQRTLTVALDPRLHVP